MKLTSLDVAAQVLAPFGYDAAVQARFAARARGSADDNAVKGVLAPLPEASLVTLPPLNSPERARLRAVGLALIRQNKVGVVVLAGGMATRFGGVVKAVVPARDDVSFLELKHHDVSAVAEAAAAAGERSGPADCAVPMFVMSSFATDAVTREFVAQKKLSTKRVPIEVFAQRVAVRLTETGEVFVDGNGELSPFATGHGDLVDALRGSGVLGRFRAAGGTMLFMTNVDNLGASLDPAILALHAERGAVITAEVVRKVAGDAGGAPALLDGVPQIIEGFRFPKAFDQSTIGVFNTNTFTLDAAGIDRHFELPYYRVEKKVEGKTVVQFERLVGELTALVPSAFVEVPRSGADSRFIAVKDPGDLEKQKEIIGRVTRSHRSLRDLREDEIF
jgi:UTP--glucose-1-phosphate uridylyltransferase